MYPSIVQPKTQCSRSAPAYGAAARAVLQERFEERASIAWRSELVRPMQATHAHPACNRRYFPTSPASAAARPREPVEAIVPSLFVLGPPGVVAEATVFDPQDGRLIVTVLRRSAT